MKTTKEKEIELDELTKKSTKIMLSPMKHMAPRHDFVKGWVFSYEDDNSESFNQALIDAHFADALGRLAESNGMTSNEVMQLFPALMRMLKSKSDWAK